MFPIMKKLFGEFSNMMRNYWDTEEATKDRPANFRLFVLIFLAATVFCITYSIIKIIS